MPKGAVPFPFGRCVVCNTQATGVHYGAATCEGCKGFFKRSLEKSEKYKCSTDGRCQVGPENRIKCKKCRFNKCLHAGMSMGAIKMGRIPKSEKQKALGMEGVSAAELSRRDNLEAPPEPKLSRNQTERPILPQPSSHVSQQYPAKPYNSAVPGQANTDSSIHQNGCQYQQSEEISYTDLTNEVIPSFLKSTISFDDKSDLLLQNQLSNDQGYARSLAAANNNNNYQWQQQLQVNKSQHQQQQDNQQLAEQSQLQIQQKQQQQHSKQQRLQKQQHRQRQEQQQRHQNEMLQQHNLHQQQIQNAQYQQQNPQYSRLPSKTTSTHNGDSANSYSQNSPTALLNQQEYSSTTGNSFNHDYRNHRSSEQLDHSAVQQNTPSSPTVQKNHLQHQSITNQHSNLQLYSQTSYKEPYQNNQHNESPQQSPQPFYDQTRSQYNVSSWIANNPQPQPILYDQPSPQKTMTSSHYYEYNATEQTSQTGSQLSVGSPRNTNKNDSLGRRSPAMSEAISVGEPDSAYASSCISEAQSSASDAILIEQELDNMDCAALIHKVAKAYWTSTKGVQEAVVVMEDCIESSGARDQTLRVKEENLPTTWEWLMESVNFYNEMILEFIKECPGFTYLETVDQTALIRHAYLPVWLIWNAPLFKNGDTHILFLNGYRYPRAWMQKILPHDFVEYLHEYAERQNNARLSINELSILTTLALTPSNVPGLKNSLLVSKVHEKYKTALNYEVTRQRVNPKEILAEIPHLLLHLNTAIARQEIILNFNEKNPPVITFNEEEDNQKSDWQSVKKRQFHNSH